MYLCVYFSDSLYAIQRELDRINTKPPLNLIEKFETDEKFNDSSHTVIHTGSKPKNVFKPIKSSTIKSRRRASDDQYCDRTSENPSEIGISPSKDDFGNKFIVDPNCLKRCESTKQKKKCISVSPILKKDPPPNPENRNPFVAGLKFRGKDSKSRTYDEILSHSER